MIRKILIVVGGIVAVTAILVVMGLAYYSRDRVLDLSKYLPNELEVCGEIITKGDPKYTALHHWLKSNIKPWKNTPASYVPTYVYSGKDFYINVFTTGVIVNAKIDGWSQVTIQAPTTTIVGECV